MILFYYYLSASLALSVTLTMDGGIPKNGFLVSMQRSKKEVEAYCSFDTQCFMEKTESSLEHGHHGGSHMDLHTVTSPTRYRLKTKMYPLSFITTISTSGLSYQYQHVV